MIKKKDSFERRKKEILRAQSKNSFSSEFIDNSTDKVKSIGSSLVKDNADLQPKRDSQKLNLKVIKKDLIKTGIYILFTLAVLYFIKSKNLEFNFGIYK